jgi:RHS repeat-associated protein
MDACPDPELPVQDQPRFSTSWVRATWTLLTGPDSEVESYLYRYEAFFKDGATIVVTNYTDTTYADGHHEFSAGRAEPMAVACGLQIHCGLYTGVEDSSSGLARVINDYMLGSNVEWVVEEDHDGNSFSVSLEYTGPAGGGETWAVERVFDGGVLPRRDMNQGKDKPPTCPKPCKGCSLGDGAEYTFRDLSNMSSSLRAVAMPQWSISLPYLNLWVHDTPVFYKTSLGKEVPFQVDFKYRDTRPADDGLYPTTGWNHNWYSYLRLNLPIMASGPVGSDTNILYTSARGIQVRANWPLTTNYTAWQAILYATDNSESHFYPGATTDAASGYTLVPIYDVGALTGFRLVHADGSQDLYSLFAGPQRSYGIVTRYGSVFDKASLSKGMAGVWRPGVLAGSDHNSWQDDDDAANFSEPQVLALSGFLQHLETYDSETPPTGPIEYLAYDVLLTKRLDPYGNAITLSYENSGDRWFLNGLTDYDGKTTSLSYSGGCVHSVTMPYGRTATFTYDNNRNLISITDAEQMTSSMGYTTVGDAMNRALASLTTPYGTTTFGYEDDRAYADVPRASYIRYRGGTKEAITNTGTMAVYLGEASVNHELTVKYPDGSSELYVYRGTTNGLPLPETLSPSQAILNAGGTLDTGDPATEASLLYRNVFHWNRAQTRLLSIAGGSGGSWMNLTEHDYLVGTMHHFLAEKSTAGDFSISSAPAFIREASPDGMHPGKITWFKYPNQSGWQIEGDPVSATEITEAPDGTPLVRAVSYDSSGRLSAVSETYTHPAGYPASRRYSYEYWDIPVDAGTGNAWSLSALKQITGPLGEPVLALNRPETAIVEGATVLNWPVVEETDAAYNVNRFFYNQRHQLIGAHYAKGLSVTNSYGANGFLQKSIALEKQATTTFAFASGELFSKTTPLGLTLTYSHDKLSRLTGITYPDGTSISKLYDRLDLVGEKDRLGGWSYASYDNMDQLISRTDRNGHSTTNTYCLCGGLASVRDPAGNTTTYTHDNLGRVSSISSAAGTASILRDSLGRAVLITSTYDLSLSRGYNLQGLVTSENNPAGAVFSAVYDEHDRPIQVTDARGVTTTTRYDNLGRVQYRWNPLGQIEYNAYSAQGLSRHFDGVGHETDYGYDGAGRLAAITNANQEVTQFGYDAADDLVSLTDGRYHPKHWAYDKYGRQVSETDANGVLARTNGYNVNGWLTSQWTPAKGLTQFGYDNNGNPTSAAYPTMGTVAYGYDTLNRRTSMSDSLGSHTFTYANFGAFDSALGSESGPWAGDTVSYGYSGKVLASIGVGSWSETIAHDIALRPYVITSPAGTFTYMFNEGGRQVGSLQMPGSATTFGYDNAGQLNAIEVTNGSPSVLDYHGYDRNQNGWITRAYRMNGVTVDYGYDNIGQLASAQGHEADSTLRLNENLAYTYDVSGNLASRTQNTLVQSFSSDAADQLTGITRSGTLTVDGSFSGAVATLGVNGQPAALYSDGTFATTAGLSLHDGNNLFVTAGSNAAGALVLSTVNPTRLPVSTAFTYDKNGNLLSDGRKVYTYDDANELVSVSVPGEWKAEFVYDGLMRRRITRNYAWQAGGWTKTNETRYICDRMLVLQERDASNNPLVTYTRGLDLSGTFQGAGGIGGLLARTDAGGSAFYHSDLGGNVTSLTDGNGSVTARYLYDPYGRLLGKWGAMADANRYLFSSKEQHPSSGLYYYGFRFYDPGMQRWLNRDPAHEAGGLNLYEFVWNDPLSVVDDSGLAPVPPPSGPPPVPVPGDPNARWFPGGSSGNRAAWRPDRTIPGRSPPSASWDPQGHWDVDSGRGTRQRFDWRGNPISARQAHSPKRPPTPRNGPRARLGCDVNLALFFAADALLREYPPPADPDKNGKCPSGTCPILKSFLFWEWIDCEPCS